MARFGVAVSFALFLLFALYIFMQFDSLSFVSAPVQHSSVTNNRIVSDEPVPSTPKDKRVYELFKKNHDSNIFKDLGLGHKPTDPLASSSRPKNTGVYGTDSTEEVANSKMFSIFVDKSETEKTFSFTPEVPSQEWVRGNVGKVLQLLGGTWPMKTDWFAVNDLTQIKTYFSNRADIIYTGIPKSGCTNWKFTILRIEKLFWEEKPTPKVH